MDRKDFSFRLPERLIAQEPLEERDAARLMLVDRSTKAIEGHRVRELPELLPQGALLVFNDSRVLKARLRARPAEGGSSVEFLLTRPRGDHSWDFICPEKRKRKEGSVWEFAGGARGTIRGNGDDASLEFDVEVDAAYLDSFGSMPLPPYIKRDAKSSDDERYQTVYARKHGSVAAPTAGLHFTESLLAKLRESGFGICHVTLHVGLGTFLPVRAERIEDHRMHEELYEVPEAASRAYADAKAKGRAVVAVGTTSARVLETAADESGRLTSGKGKTSIFIYPGYSFKAIDCLFTNFHTPESTLLMLVSAFAGKELIDKAYAKAVEEEWRFFSYGDAMLIR
jgi:S-adenosylmethionine:tRNA ribosyltransferase-isomerase